MTIDASSFERILREKCGYRGGGLAVGVSGGPDSMCLLHLLTVCRHAGRIVVLHLHHGIRGAEADKDAEHVQKWCGQLSVPLETVRRDIPAEAAALGISLEEAGRKARYEELEKLRAKLGLEAIACAHHAGDRAETVMMNILRGTGTDGLKGIGYVSGRVLRPLLGYTREDILGYLSEHGVGYVTDSSNLESDYRRNSVRNDLFSFISEKYGIDPVARLNSLGDLAALDADFLGKAAEELYARAAEDIQKGYQVTLNAETLTGAHRAVSARVIRLAVADVKGDIVDLSRDNVDAVLGIAGDTGKKTPLPHGCEAVSYYGRLYIRRCSGDGAEGETAPVLSVRLEAYDPARAAEYKAANKKRPPEAMFFDAAAVDALGGRIVLRHRMDGDRIRLERGGTKKLGDWMTDEKVPSDQRDRVWIVAAGGTVLAAVGYRVFGGFAPGKNSQKVYFLQID